MKKKDYSNYRVKNTQPIEANLNSQYLAYVMAERLRNTCFGPTTRAIAMQFALKSNMENRVYWGGLEDLYEWTAWGRSTVTKHIAILEESQVLIGAYENAELFKKEVRQNYWIFLPPENMFTCADWEDHASGKFHKNNYLKYINEFTEEGITIVPETIPDGLGMSPNGKVLFFLDGEPWLFGPTAHPYLGAM
jgi:hypothetical protein